MKSADELQNEAIIKWQQGATVEAYHLLRSIPPDQWDSKESNLTQEYLLNILEEQMRAKFFGTQAEDLARQVTEATEALEKFMRGEEGDV